MHWYLEVLRKYAVFHGRASRQEYWYFFLFNILFSIGLGVVDGVTGSSRVGIGLLGGLYSLAMFVPGVAVSIRRLHDTGRSGWWLLIGLVPLVGVIVLFIFTVQAGGAGQNQYGPDPKATAL